MYDQTNLNGRYNLRSMYAFNSHTNKATLSPTSTSDVLRPFECWLRFTHSLWIRSRQEREGFFRLLTLDSA